MLDSWNTDDTLVAEKELLPTGELCPWVGNGDPTTITIKEPFLDRLVSSFKKFTQCGVRVPVFASHQEHPDNDRGTVIDVLKKPNSRGLMSAFVKIKFHTKEALNLAKRVDVSALCPKKFLDGKGNSYEYPLRHVALTSVPVVPGLEGWKGPLLLSFNTPSGLMLSTDTGIPTMLDQILEALGVTAPDDADDDAKLQLILDEIRSLTEEETPPPAPGDLDLSLPPMMIRQCASLREQALNNLVTEGHITPAHRDELKRQYCTDEALRADFALSHENSSADSEFDRMLVQIRKIAATRPLERSGRQSLKLGRDGEKDNPLLASAKRKADKNKRK